MHVLVGDIGGTKTGLAVAEITASGLAISGHRRYPSSEFDSLDAILALYLEETGRRTAGDCPLGAFAIAGPVQDRRSKTTNLPWDVDADHLESRLSFDRVGLLNDLEAVAWGIAALGPGDLAELHPGEPSPGNACVVAAGTGLGEAGMYWDGRGHHPFATEGGHTDFAPSDEREMGLLAHLQKRYGRVSWERVVSGMGIENIYDFMLEWHQTETPDWLAEQIAEGDTAAAVAQAAASGHCQVCVETMDCFFTLYGREAGNMALKQMALGGVYLGGGIAPKNLEALKDSRFLEGFFAKGRMEDLMRRMPVHVITREDTPLLGAARFMAATG